MNKLKEAMAKAEAEMSVEAFRLKAKTTQAISVPKLGVEFKPGEDVVGELWNARGVPMLRIRDPQNPERRASLILKNAHKKVTGITLPPSVNAMGKWMEDGIAKTITGKRTEPDGYGDDGSPSWLLVLGMI